jgi:DNA-binding MarR family transcriptional regulator
MDTQSGPRETRGSNDLSALEVAESLCACATTRHIARLLTQLYDHFLRNVGVEAPQFALLVEIDKEERSHHSAIGLECGMDKTTVSRNLKLLQRKRWVKSVQGRDRRERHVTLTHAGRKQLAAAWPEWRNAQNHLRTVITGEEWAAMFQMLTRVMDAARTAHRTLAAQEAEPRKHRRPIVAGPTAPRRRHAQSTRSNRKSGNDTRT